jgi:hypothetical protein
LWNLYGLEAYFLQGTCNTKEDVIAGVGRIEYLKICTLHFRTLRGSTRRDVQRNAKLSEELVDESNGLKFRECRRANHVHNERILYMAGFIHILP